MEEPKINAWSLVGHEVELLGHAVQVINGLGANVIEIDQMTNRMHYGEKQSCTSHYFMELQNRKIIGQKIRSKILEIMIIPVCGHLMEYTDVRSFLSF